MSQHDSRGIAAPLGFRAAGMHCGIKKPGLLDLALVVSEVSGPIAGVFTTNQVVAAPAKAQTAKPAGTANSTMVDKRPQQAADQWPWPLSLFSN